MSTLMLVITARQVAFDLVDGQTIESPVHGMRHGERRHVRLPAVLSATEYDRVVAQLRQWTSEYHTSGDRPVR